MVDYYWFNFTKRAINEAKELELKAARNAKHKYMHQIGLEILQLKNIKNT